MFNKSTLTITTSALVLMSTGVAGAASNPFSDVPQDSWAYDAVATLAADGVIDGFPDGTYQGNKTMTRYEMAQIVARAMAKEDLQKADKAIVDKLAAEFAEELDNLGVRVADLEKKSDNVKFTGTARLRYDAIGFHIVFCFNLAYTCPIVVYFSFNPVFNMSMTCTIFIPISFWISSIDIAIIIT